MNFRLGYLFAAAWFAVLVGMTVPAFATHQGVAPNTALFHWTCPSLDGAKKVAEMVNDMAPNAEIAATVEYRPYHCETYPGGMLVMAVEPLGEVMLQGQKMFYWRVKLMNGMGDGYAFLTKELHVRWTRFLDGV